MLRGEGAGGLGGWWAGGRGLGGGGAGGVGRTRTRAVAMAARPSPRPVSPSPSVVVADTDTGAPHASDNAASASARRGPTVGRLPTTWTLTLPTAKPGLPDQAHDLGQQGAPEAPDHSGRSVPNTAPRSPSPAADSSASQHACAATSPSECPAQPVAPRATTAPPATSAARARTGGRRRRCRRAAAGRRPGRVIRHPGRAAPGQDGLGQHQVERSGHLERLLGSGHDQHGATDPLHEAGVVGGSLGLVGGGVGRGRGRRPARPARSPAGSGSRAARPVEGRLDEAGGVHRLDGVGDREPGHDGVGPGADRRRRPRRRARPAPAGGRRRGRAPRRRRPGSTASASATDSCRVRHRPPPAARCRPSRQAAQQRTRPRRARPGAATTTKSTARAIDERADGVHQQGLAAEDAQRLGRPGTEPLASTGRGDDGGGPHRVTVARDRAGSRLRLRATEHEAAVGGRQTLVTRCSPPAHAVARRARRRPSCRRRGSRRPGPASLPALSSRTVDLVAGTTTAGAAPARVRAG